MEKKLLYIVCSLLFFNSFKKDVRVNYVYAKQDLNGTTDANKLISDMVLVKIADNIALKWNKKSNSLIKDSNYYNYLKNKNTLRLITESIASTADLGVLVCSKKKGHLKVGDVAFLYLLENRKFYLFQCLKIQFDVLDKDCKIPRFLLDYIDKNRHTVGKKVSECMI